MELYLSIGWPLCNIGALLYIRQMSKKLMILQFGTDIVLGLFLVLIDSVTDTGTKREVLLANICDYLENILVVRTLAEHGEEEKSWQKKNEGRCVCKTTDRKIRIVKRKRRKSTKIRTHSSQAGGSIRHVQKERESIGYGVIKEKFSTDSSSEGRKGRRKPSERKETFSKGRKADSRHYSGISPVRQFHGFALQCQIDSL